MKKYITLIICIAVLAITFINLNLITDTITSYVVKQEPMQSEKINDYRKEDTLSYVTNTDSFIPYSYQDLVNIVFTTINNGWDKFTFYCSDEYEKCIFDMGDISQDSATLTHINNFVHPFNSFTDIRMTISNSGEINLEVNYLYNDTEISKINNEVDKLISELITNDMDDETKIRTVHDHIINNAKYDVSVNKGEESIYASGIAYGPLFDGFAICNGYTDLMAIFLTKLGYSNIKVATTPDEISYSTTGHIWNAVYLDNKWLHIDLTWDDPISDDGNDYLFHDYFLVTTDQMNEADEGDTVVEEHHFNQSIYYEIR